MICWFKYPFIRLLIPFAIGIWSAFSFNIISPERKPILIMLIFLSLLMGVLISTSILIKNYSLRWVFSALLFSYLLLSGFSFVRINDYKLKTNDISVTGNTPKYYYARLCEQPTIKEKSVKAILEVYGYEENKDIKSIDSKVIAYFEKEENSMNLKYGDCIIISTDPKAVEKPPNPEQFNYKDYLYKKGITHQVYIKRNCWLHLNHNISNPIYGFSYRMRDFLLMTMKNLGIDEEEHAVAAAILLGYDDSLPQELRQKYVAAGAMHILCVSGLHVGVIFMVFSYMLAFINDRKQNQNIIKQIILLALIWFYALLAGLAPSILRATIMLSFVIIGNIINRKGIVLNSLAASAFILLCINPSNIFDIGFLLSYTAVIGIVILQKPISRIFYSKYKIINKIWEITSVTIAAQIATIPFTIYYFHQFPIYFWLSNLFMTPISSVVIIGGITMLLIFYIPYINNIIAWFVSKMIFAMNYSVTWIESLPNSIIKGLYINDLQFVILILILSGTLLLIELKNKKLLFFIMTMSCLFFIVNIDKLIKQKNQKEIVFYSINNMTAIDFINGRSHVLIADSSFFNDKSAFSYNIENYLVSKGVFFDGKMEFLNNDFNHNFVKKRKNVVTFDKKLIILSDGGYFSKERLAHRTHIDYMIIYGRKRQSLSPLLNTYTFDNLIINKSTPHYIANKLIEEAKDLGINYHDLSKNGAFIIK